VEGRVARRSPTKKLRLRGTEGYADLDASDDTRTRHLANRFGGEATVLLAMIEHDPSLGEPLVEGTGYLRVEALYAARYEMARTLTDVLARRTRALLQARDATVAAAPAIATLLAGERGWDDAEVDRQVEALRVVAARELESMTSV
jgi:glycerol-3-phosphate dehydrogenase